MPNDSEWDTCFTWRIEHFSSCSPKTGERLESPAFEVKSLSGCKWSLWIYPKGYAENRKEFISCYLHQIEEVQSDKECTVDYDIKLSNSNLENFISLSIENKSFGKQCRTWGFPSLIKINQLKAEMKKCSEDTLIIRCYIKNKEEKKLYEKGARSRVTAEKYFLEWNVKVLANGILTSEKEFFCLQRNIYRISVTTNNDEITIIIYKLTPTVSKIHPIRGKVTLLDVKGNEVISKSETHTYDSNNANENWKFPSLITKKQLQDNMYEYVTDKKITFLCEFSVSKYMESASSENCISFSNIDGLLSLSEDFRNSLVSMSDADVKLQVQNGVTLQAHRSVLAARSPVFSAMFNGEMLENQTGLVKIKDVDLSSLKSFLVFLYTGMVNDIDYEKAIKLLMVAEKYQVPSLKEMCTLFLKSSLSVKNVCDLLVLADMVCHLDLKTDCMDYISENVMEIFSLLEWSEFIIKNAELSAEVTAHIGKHCIITPKHS